MLRLRYVGLTALLGALVIGPAGCGDDDGGQPECTTPSTCDGTDTACQARTCVAGTCGMEYQASGTVIAAQTAGDCLEAQCDGAGAILQIADASDVGSDGNDCTIETCDATGPVSENAAERAPCAQDGGTLCDGAGACVACLLPEDCDLGWDCIDRVCLEHQVVCVGILPANGCSTCLEGSCCAEIDACNTTAGCVDCLNGATEACTVDNEAAVGAVNACGANACSAECGGQPQLVPVCDAPMTAPSAGACVTLDANITCNPVTNEPCTAGQACDISASGFQCYDPPNDVALCGECGNEVGFCQGGLTCVGTCAKLCCDASDCGTGTCDTTSAGLPGGVGVCVVAP